MHIALTSLRIQLHPHQLFDLGAFPLVLDPQPLNFLTVDSALLERLLEEFQVLEL